MKKKLTLGLCIIAIVVSLIGCGSDAGKNNNKENSTDKKTNNEISDEEISDIFERMRNNESDIDNNIFTLLEPTHQQASPYPYDYMSHVSVSSEDDIRFVTENSAKLWSPNKPILEDVENITYIKYDGKEYDSVDKLNSTERSSGSLQIKVGIDNKEHQYLGYNFYINTLEKSLTVADAIEKEIWECSGFPVYTTQWAIENNVMDLDVANAQDTIWAVLEHLVLDWGMPSEVYYNKNDEIDMFTTSVAYLVWDCDGYDVVYYIFKDVTGLSIDYVNVYGDGCKEYLDYSYPYETHDGVVKLDKSNLGDTSENISETTTQEENTANSDVKCFVCGEEEDVSIKEYMGEELPFCKECEKLLFSN